LALCYICGKEVDLPFRCSYCNLSFCDEHRLPENHNCVNMPSRSRAHKASKGLVSSTSRKSMLRSSKEKEKPKSQWKETTTRWTNEQRNSTQGVRGRGYKKHRKLRLLVKVFLVGLLLYGGSLVAWKGGLFSEEISQKFDAVMVYLSTITGTTMNKSIGEMLDNVTIYLQGIWMSITDFASAEDSPEPESELEPDPKPDPLNPYESVDDLIMFLDNDNVSDVVYASDFKCGDFAEALVNRAHDAGYDLKVYSMFDSELENFIRYVETLEYVNVADGVTTITTFSYGLGAGHAVCKTEIGSVTYLIEPQDDMVVEIIEDGYGIVYFGEVTK